MAEPHPSVIPGVGYGANQRDVCFFSNYFSNNLGNNSLHRLRRVFFSTLYFQFSKIPTYRVERRRQMSGKDRIEESREVLSSDTCRLIFWKVAIAMGILWLTSTVGSSSPGWSTLSYLKWGTLPSSWLPILTFSNCSCGAFFFFSFTSLLEVLLIQVSTLSFEQETRPHYSSVYREILGVLPRVSRRRLSRAFCR